MSTNARMPVDGSGDGTIVNPSSHYEPDDNSVGDDADEANDRRFNEEQQLIEQQVHHDAAVGDGTKAKP
ncbi:MAG TPA: hypothetical protein VGN49_11420 [Micrococcaceae bacterium]|jgi:hypothetical protein|nr:hypothetical protein [Micrococcaceae bacterium]